MYITKKRWQALVKRVADLEGQVQSQQKTIFNLVTTNTSPYNLVIEQCQKRQRIGMFA